MFRIQSREIDPRLRYQRRQASHELQRIQNDVRGAVIIGRFQTHNHIAVIREGQALLGNGWARDISAHAGCQRYVSDGAGFSAQSEPRVDVTSVEGYCEWMPGLGSGPLEGCGYVLHSSAWDEANQTALFFATFNGKHVGEGGPVEATGQETHSHYVYVLNMEGTAKSPT